VAVRRAAAWLAPEALPAAHKPIVSIGQAALVLAAEDPRRVYVAFDLAAENTNFATSEAFVIFMANAVRYLIPSMAAGGGTAVRYESVTPIRAGPAADWTPMPTPAPAGNAFAASFAAPGLYRDAAGALHAVSLTALKSAQPAENPVKKVLALPLPAPEPQARPVDLWPALLLAAAVCWLLGWARRLR
jgi:hypothetical protein